MDCLPDFPPNPRSVLPIALDAPESLRPEENAGPVALDCVFDKLSRFVPDIITPKNTALFF